MLDPLGGDTWSFVEFPLVSTTHSRRTQQPNWIVLPVRLLQSSLARSCTV